MTQKILQLGIIQEKGIQVLTERHKRMFIAALFLIPPPKKTTNTYNMDQSLKHTE